MASGIGSTPRGGSATRGSSTTTRSPPKTTLTRWPSSGQLRLMKRIGRERLKSNSPTCVELDNFHATILIDLHCSV